MQAMVRGDRNDVIEDKSLEDVTINQIIQVLSIIPIGIVISSVILFIENFVYYLKKKGMRIKG